MRKLLTIEDLTISIATTVFYGLGWMIPQSRGLPVPLCSLICMAVGLVPNLLLERLAFSEAVQSDPRRRFALCLSNVLFFLVSQAVSVRLLGVSLIKTLFEQVTWVIGFPLVVLVVSVVVRWYRIAKIRKAYGDGRGGYTFDVDPAVLEELNRENQLISGDFDADVAVRTKTGTYVGERYKRTVFFLGIPYAKPPVGERRWKAPEPLEPTDATYEAKNLGASAIQVEHRGSVLRHHRQSEDCLTLNIGVTAKETKGVRPVIVLIHHGDFTQGGSADPLLYGSNFVGAHPEVVFVTINYRLGILGFIDFAEVPGGQAYPDAPNLGLLDQVAALRWVHENIAAFGGDPDRITVVGFESGASSISLLAATEGARDLFQRAFVFYGSSLSAYDTPDASRALARRLMEETNTSTMDELAALDTAALKDAAQRLWRSACAPTCDGTWIPLDPTEAYRQGAAAGIDFIFGIPSNEMDVLRSTVGDENYADMVSMGFDDAMGYAPEPVAQKLRAYVERQTPTSGELAAKAKAVDQLYALSMYGSASSLAAAGNRVHLLYWDEEPLLEGLGSGTVDVVATLFANGDASQMYGSLVDEDLAVALQHLLVKFAAGDDLRMFPNEIKGIDALAWEPFPQALIVSDHRLSCGSIEDRLSEVDGLLDLLEP